ncbi:ubiquitin carboxyl-terminal hydrolase 29-like [Rhynchocyon petersi]
MAKDFQTFAVVPRNRGRTRPLTLSSAVSEITCHKSEPPSPHQLIMSPQNQGKRKRSLSTQEDNVKAKKSKKDPLKCVCSRKQELWTSDDAGKSEEPPQGSSFRSTCGRDSKPEDRGHPTQHLSERRNLSSAFKVDCEQKEPGRSDIRASWDSLWQQGGQGFPNLGNTCYMNSVLQSLLAIPTFVEDLLRPGSLWDKCPPDALLLGMSRLLALKDHCDVKVKEYFLMKMKNSVSSIAEIFSGHTQNDAHEFLSHCLAQMKENMETLNATASTERMERRPPHISGGSSAGRVFPCPVVGNFEFDLQRSITCQTCARTVCKTELTNSLSLFLSQESGAQPSCLQGALNLFFRDEELEYTCEGCKSKSSCSRYTFSSLPRILIVHLKRYVWDAHGQLVKDKQRVDVPKYLTLARHCTPHTKPPLPWESCNDRRKGSYLPRASQHLTSATATSPAPQRVSQLSLVPQVDSTLKEPHAQKCKSRSKRSRGLKQKRDQESVYRVINRGSKLVIQRVRSQSHGGQQSVYKVINKGSKLVIKRVPVADSADEQKDTSVSVTSESTHQATLDPVPGLKEPLPQEEKAHFHNLPGPSRDWQEDKENWVPEGYQGARLQHQKHTGQYRRASASLSVQGANPNSLRTLASDNNHGSKNISNFPSKEAEANTQERNAAAGTVKDPRHPYRLISAISHRGTSLDSGHYITDVYDFSKKGWRHYSDLEVLHIQEDQTQEHRSHDGYIFFYMHCDIFNSLLRKPETLRKTSSM